MQKCKGMRERDNSRTTPAIHRKELFEKKGSIFFPFTNSVKIEYLFELLCGIDLNDAENLRIDKE